MSDDSNWQERLRREAPFNSVTEVSRALREARYLPDHGLATAIYLSLDMARPLLLEGEPGVGKTQVAKTLSTVLGAELIRLQCYEGIDAAQALYEWQYARQLLALRTGSDSEKEQLDLFAPEFLSERPILRAIRRGNRAVLLIDELDRADDQFEAFLLEILSDFTISIPEIGTIRAEEPPVVIITSNRTRELHDALKRRCLYHWIDYPEREREVKIITANVPGVSPLVARAIADAVEQLRLLNLDKPPGSAEAIDWAESVTRLGSAELDLATAKATLGWVVKNRDDRIRVDKQLDDIINT